MVNGKEIQELKYQVKAWKGVYSSSTYGLANVVQDPGLSIAR